MSPTFTKAPTYFWIHLLNQLLTLTRIGNGRRMSSLSSSPRSLSAPKNNLMHTETKMKSKALITINSLT